MRGESVLLEVRVAIALKTRSGKVSEEGELLGGVRSDLLELILGGNNVDLTRKHY